MRKRKWQDASRKSEKEGSNVEKERVCARERESREEDAEDRAEVS